MTLSEHDLTELLAQLNAAPLADAPSHAAASPLDATAVAVVLVGTVSEGEYGVPMWHSASGESWILV